MVCLGLAVDDGWVLLMHVVVKAAVNCIACHFNQNGEWWRLFLLFIYLFILHPFCVYSKIDARTGTAVCPSCLVGSSHPADLIHLLRSQRGKGCK